MLRLSRETGRLLVIASALALLTVACGGGGGGTNEGLSGRIAASGSSTVEPISARNAEKFSSQNPGVDISVEGPGTGDGFELFCNGETDISDASRPIDREEEVPACRQKGIEFIELKVGIDGIAVLTSPENGGVRCLSFNDLYALLGPESRGFKRWSDANALARRLGGTHAPYPDMPLVITAPGEESGTYDSFAEIVLEEVAYKKRGIKEDAPVIRPDYQSSPNDNVIIEGIGGSPSSLGWVGFAFYAQNRESVKAIPIDGEEGCVEPTEETIRNDSYPLARDLFIYVNARKAEQNPALRAFVDFYVSQDGFASGPEVGYVSLAEDEIQKTRQAWETKRTGTREA